jgi:hypothetical protein
MTRSYSAARGSEMPTAGRSIAAPGSEADQCIGDAGRIARLVVGHHDAAEFRLVGSQERVGVGLL